MVISKCTFNLYCQSAACRVVACADVRRLLPTERPKQIYFGIFYTDPESTTS